MQLCQELEGRTLLGLVGWIFPNIKTLFEICAQSRVSQNWSCLYYSVTRADWTRAGHLTQDVPISFPFILKMLVAQLCPTLCNPTDWGSLGSSVLGILQAKVLEWVSFLLQGIFLTQGLNLGLLHCRQTLYHLSHQGSSPLVSMWN